MDFTSAWPTSLKINSIVEHASVVEPVWLKVAGICKLPDANKLLVAPANSWRSFT